MTNTQTGLPDEVALYHPIEFVGLDKLTMGFLNTHLERQKGGVSGQLLVAHVVKFVIDEGLGAIEKLPYFRSSYLHDLLDKFKTKGIDLKKVKGQTIDLNKLTVLSDGKGVYQSTDAFTKTANIYSSSNYKMFHFLPFNRTISRTHVRDLVESIKENGVLSHPLMIHTDCIDGQMKYWIVDGQHRFKAFEVLGLPVHFTLYKKRGSGPVTKRDIVKLVARVNNTSRKWNLQQYLKAWTSLNAEDYKVIQDAYDKTKIAINTLLQAYSGEERTIATKKFVNGLYQTTDLEKGVMYVAWLIELKGLLPKSTNLQVSMLNLFRKYPDYDNQRMKMKLESVKGKYSFGGTQEEMLQRLESLYVGTLEEKRA